MLEEGSGFGDLPSEYAYKVLVEGLCVESDLHKARNLLQYMLNKKGVDKTRMFNIYLRALCLINNPTELLNTLVFMLQNQCQPEVIILNTVINGFCQMGRIGEALKVLNKMIIGKFCVPDAVTFTTIIQVLSKVGITQDDFEFLYHVMPNGGVRPSVVTYNVVLHGLCKLQQANEVMGFFNRLASDGVLVDSITCTIIIDVKWPSKYQDNYVQAALLKELCCLCKFIEARHFLYELFDFGVSKHFRLQYFD